MAVVNNSNITTTHSTQCLFWSACISVNTASMKIEIQIQNSFVRPSKFNNFHWIQRFQTQNKPYELCINFENLQLVKQNSNTWRMRYFIRKYWCWNWIGLEHKSCDRQSLLFILYTTCRVHAIYFVQNEFVLGKLCWH